MQFHKIRLVSQDELPAGHEWVIAEHDGRITLFITEAALTPRVLEEGVCGLPDADEATAPAARAAAAGDDVAAAQLGLVELADDDLAGH